MVFTLVLFPGFPGGNVISLPFAHLLQASGDGYGSGYEDTGAVSEAIGSEYDYYSEDSDGDGFSDEDESQAGTDPYDANSYPDAVDPAEVDTDGDGLTDSEEESGFEIKHDVWVEDSTGYYNVEEDSIGFWMEIFETVITDPKKPDTDGDGLPDGWEVNSGFNPTSRADGLADGDLDGLSVGQEYQLGTNWLDPDSDGDGLLDGDEVLLFESDPNDPNDPSPALEPEPDKESGSGVGTGSTSGSTGGKEGSEPIESAGKVDVPEGSGKASNKNSNGKIGPDSGNGKGLGNVANESEIYTQVKGVELVYSGEKSVEDTFMESGGIEYEYDEFGNTVNMITVDEPITSSGNDRLVPASGVVQALDTGSSKDFENFGATLGEYHSRIGGLGGRHIIRLPESAAILKTMGKWVGESSRESREVDFSLSDIKPGLDGKVESAVGEMKVIRLKRDSAVDEKIEKTYLLVSQYRQTSTVPPGEWKVKKVVEVKLNIVAGKTSSTDAVVLNPPVEHDFQNKVSLLPVEMVPDYNRDGRIDDKDRGRVTKDEPWRWWVNDDDDSGEYGASGDLPDVPEAAALSQRDYQDNKVDGIRDLVDFFPLHLDLEQVLIEFPSSEYQYFLKQDNVVRRDSLGVFWYPWASLDRAPDEQYSVGGFLRNLDQAKDIVSREGETITKDGIRIPDDMLDAAGKGKGMLLLEGKFITFKPLMIEIRKLDGTKLVEIEFPIKIAKVEEMYRHVDLRSVPVNPDGSDAGNVPSNLPTKTKDPGYPYPDRLTNGKYFVLVHGFNVNEEKARGWFAELFKRLHQLGSKARFVGVSWRGDAGLGGVDLSPDNFIGLEKNANYHKPVFFAMQTGDKLKDALKFTGDADVTIAAHSLGNMVVSHAIAKADFSPNRYYMIDAAVAAEAYDSANTENQRYRMLEKDWKPYIAVIGGGLFSTSARWSELFDEDDGRSDLTWVNRFEVLMDSFARTYHFYSTGEEVLQNPAIEMDTAAVFENGISGAIQLFSGRRSWVAQELVKGTSYLASAAQDFDGISKATRQAGWGFNSSYYVIGQRAAALIKPSPATVAGYSKEYLRENPVFREFLVEGLTDPSSGSALANKKLVKYHVLASGIPALSFAAGSNPIGGGNMKNRRFNMQTTFMTNADQWPTEGHEDNKSSGKWLHSDFYGVALSHIYKMYEKMVKLGSLDDEKEN
ncbi:MAG: hypothetical protein QM496_12715 [Verrucomicrobiota bacterium]